MLGAPPIASQLSAEIRKLTHPGVPAAIVGCSLICAFLQVSNASGIPPGVEPTVPPPSADSLGGCIWIAALQMSSAIGFVLAGVVAALGTASEFSQGTWAASLTIEPRRYRLAILKVVAAVTVMLAGLFLIAGLLYALVAGLGEAGLAAARTRPADTGDVLAVVAHALLVIAFAGVLGVVIALASRSDVGTFVTVPTFFVVPLLLLRIDPVTNLTPTRWIIEWMRFDSDGFNRDYLAGSSAGALSTAASGALLAACALAGIGLSLFLASLDAG